MKPKYPAVLICLFISSAISCSDPVIDKSVGNLTTGTSGTVTVDTSTFRDSNGHLLPANLTPMKFLSILKSNYSKNAELSFNVIDSFPRDWIKKTDIDSLMTLINSKDKCACVVSPLSSYIPNGHSDIGGYAIAFIDSYRKTIRLDFGLYDCPVTVQNKVIELLDWWLMRPKDFDAGG